MSRYRRARIRGATYFFTVVTHRRKHVFTDNAPARMLGDAIREVRERLPFQIDAIVLLPDHFHCLMTLPKSVHDYSTRIRCIKGAFTRAYLGCGRPEATISAAPAKENRRGIWQRRFWEHAIRDEEDFERHADYIHYNPVKHGYASCPHDWQWSTFARSTRRGWYASSWCCQCTHCQAVAPDWLFDMSNTTGE